MPGNDTRDDGTALRFWRSLEELRDDEEIRVAAKREFPADAGLWDDLESRRAFLQRAAASLSKRTGS